MDNFDEYKIDIYLTHNYDINRSDLKKKCSFAFNFN